MAGAVQTLQNAWLRRGLAARLLLPLALIYGWLATLHRALYAARLLRRERLPVPVLVVGNVVAGGAGKTPVVIALARQLAARGISVGVLSRGHGRNASDCRSVEPGNAPAEVGDEALLIRQAAAVPVFVAPRRADAGRALLAAHAATQLLICDDGLQHHALERDVEIVVFDERGGSGIGNGWLLPAGPLREPWPRRHVLTRPTLVLHTGEQPAFAGHHARRRLADHALRADGQQIALDTLRGQPLAAVAGIARPEAFFEMLRARGLRLEVAHALPDHHRYDTAPPSPQRMPLLCTEKDAAKLWRHRPDAWAVPLELMLEPAFLEALDQALAATHEAIPSHHGHTTA